MTVTTTEVYIVCSISNPSVTVSNVEVAPSASSIIIDIINPTVIQSSVGITPNVISCILESTLSDAIQESLTLTPTPGWIILTRANPGIQLSDVIAVADAIYLVCGVGVPIVDLSGWVYVEANDIYLVTSCVDPTIHLSDSISEPTPIYYLASVSGPSILSGYLLAPGGRIVRYNKKDGFINYRKYAAA
jgi:hypothetical protein